MKIDLQCSVRQHNYNFSAFFSCSFKKIFHLFIFRERGREGERGVRRTAVWERNVNWLPLVCTLTRNQTRNPRMCPDWELNQLPFTLRDDAQATEPHQSGLYVHFKMHFYNSAMRGQRNIPTLLAWPDKWPWHWYHCVGTGGGIFPILLLFLCFSWVLLASSLAPIHSLSSDFMPSAF